MKRLLLGAVASLVAITCASTDAQAQALGCGGLSATDEVMWACGMKISNAATFETNLANSSPKCCGMTGGNAFRACTNVPCTPGGTLDSTIGNASQCFNNPQPQSQTSCPPETQVGDLMVQPLGQGCVNCCSKQFFAQFDLNAEVAGGIWKVTAAGSVTFTCSGQMMAISTCNTGTDIVKANQNGCYVDKAAQTLITISATTTDTIGFQGLGGIAGKGTFTVKGTCNASTKPVPAYSYVHQSCLES